MDRLQDKRLILSDFYRKEVIRLRHQIQVILEDSFNVESILERLVMEEFYFNTEETYNDKNKKYNYFYIILSDPEGKPIYTPDIKIHTEDIISFDINLPQFRGELSFISENFFNKEEVVCLMSIFSKLNDILTIVSRNEMKKRIPKVLNEAISRGSLETKDQIKILNEMLKELIDKSSDSPDFLFKFNLIFQNVINTVERVGVMAQSYLGLIDKDNISSKSKKPVRLKTAFEDALSMMPTDVDKDKFSIFIDDNIIIKIDEDKLRYAISNILSYGNRKSDHITIYTEYLHKGEDVVISIVLSGVNLDEKEILSLDENKLKNCIELSSAIEYVKEVFKGRFWIDSSPSKGTTLSLSLPVE